MPFDASNPDGLARGDTAPTRYRSRARRVRAAILPSRSFEAAVRDLLQTTRARIAQPDGWCNGHYRDDNGGVCLLTALRTAGRHADPDVLIRARAALLATAYCRGFGSIELMNDGLQLGQVLAAVDQASAGLRG